MQVWKLCKENNIYEVNNYGDIRHIKRKQILKQYKKCGYNRITITINKKYKTLSVHRIVANAFIDNPNNLPQVNHINGIKTDNRVENLEWVTASGNIKHAYKVGLLKNSEKQKASARIVGKNFSKPIKCIELNLIFKSVKEASEYFNILNTSISNNATGRSKSCNGYKFEYC